MKHLLTMLVISFAATACQVEERYAGGPLVIRADTPETTLVAMFDVLRGDSRVGRVRIYRFGDDATKFVRRVFDTRGRPLGYITSDGKAYRVRAHGGPDLVAIGGAIEKSVAAVLGMSGERVALKPAKGPDQGK
jgi:hypothetical protein